MPASLKIISINSEITESFGRQSYYAMRALTESYYYYIVINMNLIFIETKNMHFENNFTKNNQVKLSQRELERNARLFLFFVSLFVFDKKA